MDKLRERLAAIVAQLSELNQLEGLEPSQVEEVNALTNEATSIQSEIQAKEAMQNLIQTTTEPVKPKTQQTSNQRPRTEVGLPQRTQNGMHGFDTIGDFFMALKEDPRGLSNENLKIMASQREKVGEDGGFLVPDEMIGDIQKKIEGDESLLTRCRQLKTSGNRITIPVDENAPWDGSSSNFEAYWAGEEKTASESQKKMKEADIKLHKLQAKISVTDEMLEDAPLIESIIMADAPEVIMSKINTAIINGDGVHMPEGILRSGFGYQVAKEAGQSADSVVFNNLKKLYTHALPKAKRDGIFVHNVAVEEELIGMRLDPASSDSVSVYLPNNSISGAPYGTLWGKPVFPMAGALPALGDKGDICFIDLAYYYAAIKTGKITKKISVHALWDQDKTSYKFTFRVGGQCPFKVPASTEFGDYKLSGFTYLQERA